MTPDQNRIIVSALIFRFDTVYSFMNTTDFITRSGVDDALDEMRKIVFTYKCFCEQNHVAADRPDGFCLPTNQESLVRLSRNFDKLKAKLEGMLDGDVEASITADDQM